MKTSRAVAASLLALVLTLSFLPLPAHAFSEQLDYELTWNGMKIGTSNLRTSTSPNGDEMEIVSTVNSEIWTHPFYKVEDVETSKLKRAGKGYVLSSYKMKLHEGRNDWHRAATVDRKQNAFRFVDLITFEKGLQKLVEPAWDPVSCLYHLRQQPLAVGKPVYVNVLDKKKLNRIKVNVLRRENITTPAGTFRTIVISPDMSIESQGLFYAQGPLTIWLSDDARRVPVAIEKRIENLFRDGVPYYLERFMPAEVKKNLPKLETIRAVLVPPEVNSRR